MGGMIAFDPQLAPTPLAPPDGPLPLAGERRRRIPRGLEVFAGLLRVLPRLTGGAQPGDPMAAENGRIVRETLEGLGGFWMWIGETLAIQEEAFGVDFCRELAKISTASPVHPFELIRKTIEEDRREPLETLFTSFEEAPFAAGATAQIHRAVLRRGGWRVAVKVLRPDVDRTFRRDERMVRAVLRRFASMTRLRHLRLADAIWEFDQQFKEALDLRREAAALANMRKELSRHGVIAPRTWTRLASRRVLIEEYIPGVRLSDYIRMAETDPDRARTWAHVNEVDPDRVGKRLLRSFLRQVLEDAHFHGDLNPANVLLLRGGRLAVVDFGLVGRPSREFQDVFGRYLRALSMRDYHDAAHRLLVLAEPVPPVDIDKLKRHLIQVYRAWDFRTRTRELPFTERSYLALTAEVARTLTQARFSLEWSMMRIDLALLAIDSSLRHLCPRMDFLEEVDRFFRRHDVRIVRRSADSKQLGRSLAQTFPILERIPQKMSDFIADFEAMGARGGLAFDAPVGKVASVLAALNWRLRIVLVVLGLCLLGIFAHQELGVPSWERTDSILLERVARLPSLGLAEWSIIGVVYFLFHRSLVRVSRILSRRIAHPPQRFG